MDEALRVTLHVTGILDGLGVEYLLGGSLASSLHGIPRATLDADLVAALSAAHVEPLVAALGGEFYIHEDDVRDALRHGSSFNVIHLPTMFKVDVFISGSGEVARLEMDRRQTVAVDETGHVQIVVASAEDIIVQKLHWYREGGEVSDRQWQDVLGVIQIQGPRLDQAYLRKAASLLRVETLLQRALREAG